MLNKECPNNAQQTNTSNSDTLRTPKLKLNSYIYISNPMTIYNTKIILQLQNKHDRALDFSSFFFFPLLFFLDQHLSKSNSNQIKTIQNNPQ